MLYKTLHSTINNLLLHVLNTYTKRIYTGVTLNLKLTIPVDEFLISWDGLWDVWNKLISK